MNPRRPRSIEIAGVSHGKAPIPMGARVGGTLYSSAIPGVDPATGQLAAGAELQARFAFENMKAMLAAGGATLDDVVRMTVYLKDDACRQHVNEQWLRSFPDPNDRPARHVLMHDLQHGMLLQIEVVAVIANQGGAS